MTETFEHKSLNEIPEAFRCIFKAYPCLNHVQSTVFNDIFHSQSSVVVTAPTGSGKTLLFELAVIKLFHDAKDKSGVKAVYIAPTKALCYERFLDWKSRFEEVGISCLKITGDTDYQTLVDDFEVILTTPEKWDALTRKWRDNIKVLQKVKLLMVDEVHLLGDRKRGPVLETIVCRMKTMTRILKINERIRFIAVSATISNIEDLSAWLDSAVFHTFGNEVRPVALKRVVKGFPQPKGQSPFLFDICLSFKLKFIILEYADRKPTLIFCTTRKGVLQTAKVLSDQLSLRFSDDQKQILNSFAAQLSDPSLRVLALAGICYHHAGMTVEDRCLVQETFMQGSLPVLVATSTLAMGVNLPAHLVIIKSTHQYIAGKVEEYPESSILQMVGRAGRPQFDTSATAVIVTRSEMVTRYENLLNCREVLESSLHLQLTEHLNAEIVLYTITDLSFAMEWLRCTFLYQRVFKNPRRYCLNSTASNPTKIEKELETMVLREINALHQAGLVQLNENGIDVAPTVNGRLMSHFYINFHTFCLFSRVEPTATLEDLLNLLSDAEELKELQLRVSERRALNELNVNKLQETIRFPVSGKISNAVLKIKVLAQACLGCLTVSDPSLQQESIRIVSTLERVAKCLAVFLVRSRSYCSFLSAVLLAKCLYARLWENSIFIARQLPRIGPSLGASFASCGKTSFTALENSHPQELERIMNRGPPAGSMVIRHVRHLPRYAMRVDVNRESSKYQVVISVSLTNASVLAEHSTTGPRHSVAFIVGDSQNHLLHQRQIYDSALISQPVEVTISLNVPSPKFIYVHVISEQWVGFDIVRDVMIDPLADTFVKLNCQLPSGVSSTVGKKRKCKEKIVDNCALPKSNYWEKGSLNNSNHGKTENKRTNRSENNEAMFVSCCFDLEPSSEGDNEMNKENICTNDGPKSTKKYGGPVKKRKFQDERAHYQMKKNHVEEPRCHVRGSELMQRFLNDYVEYGTRAAANATLVETSVGDKENSHNIANLPKCSLDDGNGQILASKSCNNNFRKQLMPMQESYIVESHSAVKNDDAVQYECMDADVPSNQSEQEKTFTRVHDESVDYSYLNERNCIQNGGEVSENDVHLIRDESFFSLSRVLTGNLASDDTSTHAGTAIGHVDGSGRLGDKFSMLSCSPPPANRDTDHYKADIPENSANNMYLKEGSSMLFTKIPCSASESPFKLKNHIDHVRYEISPPMELEKSVLSSFEKETTNSENDVSFPNAESCLCVCDAVNIDENNSDKVKYCTRALNTTYGVFNDQYQQCMPFKATIDNGSLNKNSLAAKEQIGANSSSTLVEHTRMSKSTDNTTDNLVGANNCSFQKRVDFDGSMTKELSEYEIFLNTMCGNRVFGTINEGKEDGSSSSSISYSPWESVAGSGVKEGNSLPTNEIEKNYSDNGGGDYKSNSSFTMMPPTLVPLSKNVAIFRDGFGEVQSIEGNNYKSKVVESDCFKEGFGHISCLSTPANYRNYVVNDVETDEENLRYKRPPSAEPECSNINEFQSFPAYDRADNLKNGNSAASFADKSRDHFSSTSSCLVQQSSTKISSELNVRVNPDRDVYSNNGNVSCKTNPTQSYVIQDTIINKPSRSIPFSSGKFMYNKIIEENKAIGNSVNTLPGQWHGNFNIMPIVPVFGRSAVENHDRNKKVLFSESKEVMPQFESFQSNKSCLKNVDNNDKGVSVNSKGSVSVKHSLPVTSSSLQTPVANCIVRRLPEEPFLETSSSGPEISSEGSECGKMKKNGQDNRIMLESTSFGDNTFYSLNSTCAENGEKESMLITPKMNDSSDSKFIRNNSAKSKKIQKEAMIQEENLCSFEVISQNMSQSSKTSECLVSNESVVKQDQPESSKLKPKFEDYLGRTVGKLDLEAIDVIIANAKLAKARFYKQIQMNEKW